MLAVEIGTDVEVQHARGELLTVSPNTKVVLISVKKF